MRHETSGERRASAFGIAHRLGSATRRHGAWKRDAELGRRSSIDRTTLEVEHLIVEIALDHLENEQAPVRRRDAIVAVDSAK